MFVVACFYRDGAYDWEEFWTPRQAEEYALLSESINELFQVGAEVLIYHV